MKEKRKLILDAFNNKHVRRVPVGFWWHFSDAEVEITGGKTIVTGILTHNGVTKKI